MTTEEMIIQLWENAGEPTDLDPLNSAGDAVDATTDGAVHFIELISQAQKTLSNWKTNNGRPIRFKDFQVQRNVKLMLDEREHDIVVESNVLSSSSITISKTNQDDTHFYDNSLESALCEITFTYTDTQSTEDPKPVITVTEERMVMFVENNPSGSEFFTALFFREPFDYPTYVDENGDTQRYDLTAVGNSAKVKFFFDRFEIKNEGPERDSAYLAMPTSFRNILKVIDGDNGSVLTRATSKTNLFNLNLTTGDPSQFYVLGSKIYFDVYFEEPKWFVIEYQKLPETLTISSGVLPSLEIPEHWHDVLIEMVEYNLAKRAQEKDLIAIKFSNINRLIAHLRTDEQEMSLRDDLGGYTIGFSS